MLINSRDFMRQYHAVSNPHAEKAARFEDTTYFFRYTHLMETLADHILKKPAGEVSNILFAPCSVGCEPLSFAMIADNKGVFEAHPDLQISALDISEDLIQLAQIGSYPAGISKRLGTLAPLGQFFSGIPRGYEKYFSLREEDNMVDIDETIRSRVTYLPAQDISEHKPEKPYDAVVCLNLFLHLKSEQCREVFNNVVTMAKGLVCANDTQMLDRDYFHGLMKRQKRVFVAVNDDFTDAMHVYPKSSEYEYSRLTTRKQGSGALVLRVL